VRIEEKRDGTSLRLSRPTVNLLVQGEEKRAGHRNRPGRGPGEDLAIESEDFEAAMRAIAKLREPIDSLLRSRDGQHRRSKASVRTG
jgi:hypothetical protein